MVLCERWCVFLKFILRIAMNYGFLSILIAHKICNILEKTWSEFCRAVSGLVVANEAVKKDVLWRFLPQKVHILSPKDLVALPSHLARWCIWLSRPPHTRKVGSSILSRVNKDKIFLFAFVFRGVFEKFTLPSQASLALTLGRWSENE